MKFFTFMIALILNGLPALSADSAFSNLSKLAGKWSIQSNGETLPFQMQYEVASKGNVLTEYFGKELSVFYQDNGELHMTHFCNQGIRSQLRLNKEKIPKFYEFKTYKTENLETPSLPFVDRIIYSDLSKPDIELEIVWKNGSKEMSEKYRLSTFRSSELNLKNEILEIKPKSNNGK